MCVGGGPSLSLSPSRRAPPSHPSNSLALTSKSETLVYLFRLSGGPAAEVAARAAAPARSTHPPSPGPPAVSATSGRSGVSRQYTRSQ